MSDKKHMIIIYEPEVLFWGVAAGFHGYAIEFINLYADYIYIRKTIKNYLKFKIQIRKMGIKKSIPFKYHLDDNDANSVLVGFTIPRKDNDELLRFSGLKFFHLMDYYLSISHNLDFLRKYKVNYVVGHTKMDMFCQLFKDYYSEYIGKVISLPFGYQERFKNIISFDNRKNIAIGLGSINPIDDPLLPYDEKKEFMEYFCNESFMHPVRRYIQTHEEEFMNVIECRFPSVEKQKDFSYDAVKMLNSYTMFLNDAGLSNFPPARTYEGIACGCVMVAPISEIYKDIGFEAGVNYIGYQEGNYIDLHDKILYYIKHKDELKTIRTNSLKLAERFSHKKIADMLKKSIDSFLEEKTI